MTIEEFRALAEGKLPVLNVCGPAQRMDIRQDLEDALREEARRCWRSIHVKESAEIDKLSKVIADLRAQIDQMRQREHDMMVRHNAEVAALARISPLRKAFRAAMDRIRPRRVAA